MPSRPKHEQISSSRSQTPDTSAPLSTSDIARYCHVTQVAVWKWIKKGWINAYRLPGGQYRVEREAFRAFLREHDMPVDPDFFARANRRILIIDDEPPVVEVALRAVHRLGKDVLVATAGDGFEAGLQVATFKPDLMILDLMMPGMDGFQVCHLVRSNPATAHIKIIIITAYGSHENLQRALDTGADDFVHKPIDLDLLVQKVEALLA